MGLMKAVSDADCYALWHLLRQTLHTVDDYPAKLQVNKVINDTMVESIRIRVSWNHRNIHFTKFYKMPVKDLNGAAVNFRYMLEGRLLKLGYLQDPDND